MSEGLDALLKRPNVCTISGSATVPGEFDRVSFTVRIRGNGSTSVEAKEKVKAPLDALEALMALIQSDGRIKFSQRVTSPFSVSREDRWDDERDEYIFSHYAACYSLTFVVNGTEHTTFLMDELTNIEGVEVDSPTFQINSEQRQQLMDEALKLAVEDAKKQFQKQCDLLGKNTEDYEVHGWSQGGFGGTGITGCAGDSNASAMNGIQNYSKRIIVNSGVAKVTASITLSYTHTLKSIAASALALMNELHNQ